MRKLLKKPTTPILISNQAEMNFAMSVFPSTDYPTEFTTPFYIIVTYNGVRFSNKEFNFLRIRDIMNTSEFYKFRDSLKELLKLKQEEMRQIKMKRTSHEMNLEGQVLYSENKYELCLINKAYMTICLPKNSNMKHPVSQEYLWGQLHSRFPKIGLGK